MKQHPSAAAHPRHGALTATEDAFIYRHWTEKVGDEDPSFVRLPMRHKKTPEELVAAERPEIARIDLRESLNRNDLRPWYFRNTPCEVASITNHHPVMEVTSDRSFTVFVNNRHTTL